MKKKDLIEKIIELIEAINSLQRQLNEVKNDNKELKEKISQLEDKVNASVKATPEIVQEISEILMDAEETVTQEPEITVTEINREEDEMEYGSVAIGKVIQESIKYANLINESAVDNKKELLNLIMGKAEVVKAEIFAICEGETSINIKKELIDAQCAEAVDYFKSAYGQIAG